MFTLEPLPGFQAKEYLFYCKPLEGKAKSVTQPEMDISYFA